MTGTAIVAGRASGPVIASSEGLSFWGGVDPATGKVIDAHHPLHGQSITGAVLMMPTTRGSCTGSGVLLELALTGRAPAALIFREAEDILTLGALIAGKMFGQSLPVLRLSPAAYDSIAAAPHATITDTHINDIPLTEQTATLSLTPEDRAMLAADPATRLAMEVICTMATNQGAAGLTTVTQGHIDGCIYASPANLLFAETMADMGAKTRIPTTMNAISVDRANWQAQGVPPDFGIPASRLADAYVRMGARPTFTCAPYLLDSAPKADESVAWAESNAVIYANTVLGARTVKHPDFLDLMIAITGRAPRSGVYVTENRRPARIIRVEHTDESDAFWPLLGYVAGLRSPDRIPLLQGIDKAPPDGLKALCAAFGTTSAAPMLHIEGITPERLPPLDTADTATITRADLAAAWHQFNQGPESVDLVAFGSPHFSLTECCALAALVKGLRATIAVVVTCGRDVIAAAKAEGTLATLESFGVKVIPDLCWCSISEPVFPPETRTLMTNSGKYAHYAPGLSGRAVRFGSLADCVDTAVTGRAPTIPDWLR